MLYKLSATVHNEVILEADCGVIFSSSSIYFFLLLCQRFEDLFYLLDYFNVK